MNDMQSDLSRMVRLFSRISPSLAFSSCGLTPIAEIFKQHIVDLGTDRINQRMARIGAAAEVGGVAKKKESTVAAAAEKDGGGKESSDDPQFIKVSTSERLFLYVELIFKPNSRNYWLCMTST